VRNEIYRCETLLPGCSLTNCGYDARNGATTYAYNAADQVVTMTTPAPGGGYAAQTTTTLYDSSGRAWKTVLPDGTSTTNEFHLTGQLKKTSGSRTYPVEYTYDSQGRMKTMKTWQSFSGNSGTAITTWNYDANRGWLASKDYADATTGNAGTVGNDYLYSDAGRLRTNQLARIVSGSTRLQRVYTYGSGGDLSTITYNDGGITPGVTFTYDRLGRRATAARGSTTTTFSYTTASLPLGESHAGGTLGGWAVTNTFDGNLRRATVAGTLSGVAQFTQGYGYDTAGRLQAATSGSFAAEYGYHANSPLVSTVSHRYGGNNRMVTTKQYDFINRLSSIANGAYDSHAYGYNAANQRTNVVRADGSYWVYAYDNLGQVISGKRYWSDGTPVAGQQHEYVFDDIGNRTSAKSGGNSSGTGLRTENYTRNRLNQYTQKDEAATFDVLGLANASATVTVNGSSAYRKNEYFHKEVSVSNGSAPVWQSVSTIASLGGSTTTNTGNMYVAKTPEVLTYDLDGNQLTDGRWSNTWDAENRLTIQETIGTVPAGAKKRLIHEYDWMGRRIRKQVYDWVSSAWSLVRDERFLYDGWNVIAILSSATTIQQTQLWGKDLSGTLQGAGGVGGLLALTHYPSAKTYFTGYDGNGNVTVLIDGVSGLTEGNFEYGPFGELIRASGTAVAVCPWRFSTKYEDAETGMLYYGYRFYNPSTGRWLSRDPIEEDGGPNLFAFVYNQPQHFVDVLGEQGWALPWGGPNTPYDPSRNPFHGPPPDWDSPEGEMALGVMSIVVPIGVAAALAQGNLAALTAEGVAYVIKPIKAGKMLAGCCREFLVKITRKKVNAGAPVPTCAATSRGLGDDFAKALDDIAGGKPRPNVRNPKPFTNDGRGGTPKLPTKDGAGNPVDYTEHTVNPRPPGGKLDGNRIVTGSDGSVWATKDHFKTWTQIK
jgi:RHS repeat-associated protein